MTDVLRPATDPYTPPAEGTIVERAILTDDERRVMTVAYSSSDSLVGNPQNWNRTRLRFSLLKEEVAFPDSWDESVAFEPEAVEETELTEEDEFIGEAYMMAKRAVRIAKETGENPEYYIGSGDRLKEKAINFLPFVLANIVE